MKSCTWNNQPNVQTHRPTTTANDFVTKHMKQRRATFAKTRKDPDFNDVTFVIGETKSKFHVNRMVMASLSDVMKAMLYGAYQESQDDAEIVLEDVKPVAFERVLQFAYCSAPDITPENVLAVAMIADKYQIKELIQICKEAVKTVLSGHWLSKFCLLWDQAVQYKLNTYKTTLKSVIKSLNGNIHQEIIQNQAFRKMSVSAMKEFLSFNFLNVQEQFLWRNVARWADEQANLLHAKRRKLNRSERASARNLRQNRKKKVLKEVVPFIRFGLKDGTFFVKEVKACGCLSKEDIADILCYIQCGDGKCGRFKTTKRGSRR